MQPSNCPFCNTMVNQEGTFCYNCAGNLHLPKKIETIQDISSKEYIEQDYLQQYLEITDKLKALEGFEREIQEQKDHYTILSSEYQKAKSKYKALQEQLNSEQQDVEKLKKLNWNSIRARIKGEFDSQLQREEAEYLEVLHHLEYTEQSIHDLDKKMKIVEQQYNEMKGVLETKKSLEHQLRELVYNAAEGVSDIVEDHIELQLSDLAKKIDPFLIEKSRYQSSLELISQAINILKNAKQLFIQSTEEKMVGGGLLTDSVKNSTMADIRDKISIACQLINQSIQLLEHIKIESHELSVQQGKFWESFIHNYIKELNQGSKHIKSQKQIENAIRDATKIMSWLNSKINSTNTQISILLKEIKELQNELFEERKRMIIESIDKMK